MSPVHMAPSDINSNCYTEEKYIGRKAMIGSIVWGACLFLHHQLQPNMEARRTQRPPFGPPQLGGSWRIRHSQCFLKNCPAGLRRWKVH